MRRATSLLLLVLLVPPLGCRKKPLEPSPHWEKASAFYQQLYVRELDDAYGDPRMDEVVAELKVVPEDSLDRGSAQQLLGTIERGRKELEKQRADREKMRLELERGLAQPSTIDPTAVLRASGSLQTYEEPKAAGGGLDAGPADPYGPGATVAEINTATGGCLASTGQPFTEEGTRRTGVTYRLASSQACQEKLPGFVNQIVLVVDGHIYRRVGAAEVHTVEVVTVAPDAGTGPAKPKPAAPAATGEPGTDAAAAPAVSYTGVRPTNAAPPPPAQEGATGAAAPQPADQPQ